MKYIKKKKKASSKKRKKTPYELQKEKTWSACSKYNRRKMANSDGIVYCVTCFAKRHWKEMQAGHWLDGRGNAILFEDDCIHAQDMYCNFYGGGNKINVKENYHRFMEDQYGQERMDELIALKNTTRKFTIEELYDMEQDYQDKLVGLDMKYLGRM